MAIIATKILHEIEKRVDSRVTHETKPILRNHAYTERFLDNFFRFDYSTLLKKKVYFVCYIFYKLKTKTDSNYCNCYVSKNCGNWINL